MKRILTAAVAVVLVVAGFCLPAGSQDDMTHVDPGAFFDPQRSASIFPHDDHNLIAEIDDCGQCHHVYEDGRLVEGESSEDMLCSDCHALEPSGSQPGLMNAFHRNCKGCHQERNAGPVMCGECHVR